MDKLVIYLNVKDHDPEFVPGWKLNIIVKCIRGCCSINPKLTFNEDVCFTINDTIIETINGIDTIQYLCNGRKWNLVEKCLQLIKDTLLERKRQNTVDAQSVKFTIEWSWKVRKMYADVERKIPHEFLWNLVLFMTIVINCNVFVFFKYKNMIPILIACVDYNWDNSMKIQHAAALSLCIGLYVLNKNSLTNDFGSKCNKKLITIAKRMLKHGAIRSLSQFGIALICDLKFNVARMSKTLKNVAACKWGKKQFVYEASVIAGCFRFVMACIDVYMAENINAVKKREKMELNDKLYNVIGKYIKHAIYSDIDKTLDVIESYFIQLLDIDTTNENHVAILLMDESLRDTIEDSLEKVKSIKQNNSLNRANFVQELKTLNRGNYTQVK